MTPSPTGVVRTAIGTPAPARARRAGVERRRRGLPPLRYLLHGRRRHARRVGDQGYVDLYSPLVAGACIATLMLSCLDAYFTLLLIAGGARELNPFMDVLLHRDLTLFIGVKVALTAVGLLVLTVHHDFRVAGRLRVRHLKFTLFGLYAALVGYELALLVSR